MNDIAAVLINEDKNPRGTNKALFDDTGASSNKTTIAKPDD